MRRNTFLRAAALIRAVQAQDTREWTLVLPPMTSHGWTDNDHDSRRGFLPWSRFLDLDGMRRIHPRIIELDEYMQRHGGGNTVNATVLAKVCDPAESSCKCKMDRVRGWPGVGGFAPSRKNSDEEEACVEHPLVLGIARVRFPDHLVCLPDTWLEADDPRVVQALLRPDLRESVYFHDKEQMVDRDALFWEMRRHIAFSAHLVELAHHFHDRYMNSEGYLALHLRRGDFLTAHAGLVPSLLEVVKIARAVLKEQGLQQVFVATDGTRGRGHGAHADVAYLRKRMPSGIKVFSYAPEKDVQLHMGEVALVEQLLCAEAAYFIGTQTSMFSDLVLQERAVHGKAVKSAALFEGEGDVGYDRSRAPDSDGLLRARGYDSGEHKAPAYAM